MSFAPYYNEDGMKQPRIMGCFTEKSWESFFEYSGRDEKDNWAPEFTHLIFMSNGSTRKAIVKKTVAIVVIDEAADGSPITEKWQIKMHRNYP